MDLKTGDTRLIIDVCKSCGVLRNHAAYVLATAWHETGGTMRPVRETFASSDKQAIARLDAAWAKGQLPWVTKPYWRDGWFGRGYAQITHEYNYQKAKNRLGVDFVKNPSLVMQPEFASRILVVGMVQGWFTGKKLGDFITLSKSNFFDARAIINGDKNKPVKKGSPTLMGDLIAGYAKQYDALLKAEGYGAASSPAPAKPVAPPAPVPVGLWASILATLAICGAWLADLPCNLIGALCQ